MKAVNRKTPGHGYRTHSGNRLSFQGRWYVCPGLLSRLAGREFEVYYDRLTWVCSTSSLRGTTLGKPTAQSLMGSRVSEWEAKAMRKHDEMQAEVARARTQDEAASSRKR